MTIYKVWESYSDAREFVKFFSTKETAMAYFDAIVNYHDRLDYASLTQWDDYDDVFEETRRVAGFQRPFLPEPSITYHAQSNHKER